MRKIRFPFIQNILYYITGLGALIWFLVRVIPKPSRASYPCMRAAAPIASGFVLYLTGLLSSAIFFRKFRRSLSQSKYLIAGVFLFIGLLAGLLTLAIPDKPAFSNYQAASQLVNDPMGEAKGIHPGRVAWIHNPDATNENCMNTYGDGWFLSKNNDQTVIDQMVSDAIQLLTGAVSDNEAWKDLFEYFNQNHGKGTVSYAPGEKILIKTNAASAWLENYNTSDLSIVNNANYGIAETSPQAVLAVLRQLVNVVGIAESDIYVGDPMRHIYKHCYDLWYSEFPDVNYLDNSYGPELGRVTVVQSSAPLIFYSDRGAVLRTGLWEDPGAGDPVTEDRLYTVFQDADYIINIPALKAHSRAGISLFAKNHFGSQCREYALHIHMGLVNPDGFDSANSRFGGGLYRVQVDLMGHQLLGGKELFYLLDGLWAGSESIDPPTRWSIAPFNNDWTSSIFASQDPVAIESVGYDFLKAEYTIGHAAGSYPQMDGVDDYLHQAADNTTWPVGIAYDPENDGILLPSLGVHEHWNNVTAKQYSRNLGTGDGIELVTPPAKVLGDVDGDGLINSTDALIILSCDIGIDVSQFCPMTCGDVNADGLVNSTDTLLVLSYDAALDVPYPVGLPGCPSSVTTCAGCTP